MSGKCSLPSPRPSRQPVQQPEDSVRARQWGRIHFQLGFPEVEQLLTTLLVCGGDSGVMTAFPRACPVCAPGAWEGHLAWASHCEGLQMWTCDNVTAEVICSHRTLGGTTEEMCTLQSCPCGSVLPHSLVLCVSQEGGLHFTSHKTTLQPRWGWRIKHFGKGTHCKFSTFFSFLFSVLALVTFHFLLSSSLKKWQ